MQSPDAPTPDRMDRALARIDEHMTRGNELMTRGNELMAEVREEMRLNREERADLRHFMRDLVRRFERTTNEQVRALRDIQDTVSRLCTNVDDLREESMAQRSALWALADRMGPPRAGGANA